MEYLRIQKNEIYKKIEHILEYFFLFVSVDKP